MIDDDLGATIRRLYHAEKWKIHTIATELGIHHSTVKRAIEDPKAEVRRQPRQTKLDPYAPLIRETLKKHPRLPATTLHRMLSERGYKGSASELRRIIRSRGLRPSPSAEAFHQLQTLPGEEAQVDWAHLDGVRVGDTERRVYALLMVLSHSRALHVGFYLEMKTNAVLEAHTDAFRFFGGVPRKIIYDGMKTAVLERQGRATRWNKHLLACADHYRYEPVAAGVRRPTDKGRVERAVRYLRSSMLAGHTFHSLDGYRRCFEQWRRTTAHTRTHPDDETRTVAEVLDDERRCLQSLPAHEFATDRTVIARVDSYAHVRFETNRYSVPPQYVRHQLTLLISSEWVRVVSAGEVVAVHPRCWQRKQTWTHKDHAEQIRARKPRAHDLSARKELFTELPIAEILLCEAAKRGEFLGPQVGRLRQLVAMWGADSVDLACEEAIERGTPRADSVAWLLQRGDIAPRPCLDRNLLPDRPGVRDTHVSNHPMSNYDQPHNGDDNEHTE